MIWSSAEIRRRREARGWTQQQLADAIGGSRRAVASWEKGDVQPQGRFIGQLEAVLGGALPGEDEEGPLLRDADFAETVNHLLDLYQRAVRGRISSTVEADDEPLPAGFEDAHTTIAGGQEAEPTTTTRRASNHPDR